MIYRQYADLLKKQGVRPIESSDRRFDPAVHQAVLTEESDAVEEPEVAEVLQRGFWIQDRLLRPAMVKVLVPKKKEEAK
jgi:molecular chaperone GrpE